MLKITAEDVPDIRTYAVDCPAAMAEFFHEELSLDPGRRSSSAQVLIRRLQGLRALTAPSSRPSGKT